MTIHFLNNSYFQVCKIKFNQRSLWNQHCNGTHATTHNLVLKNEGPFICDFCGKIYERRFALIRHLIKFHRKAKAYCDLCPKSFNFLFQLEQHLLGLHLKNVCDICGFEASRRNILLQHKQKHEPKTECQTCHKLIRNIKRHQKKHRKMTCDMCPNSYYLKSDLKMHFQKTHLKKKLHVCDVCGYKNVKKSHLERHKKIHKLKLKCPICHKPVSDFKEHKYRAHPEKNKLLVCDVCGFKSAHKSVLRCHMKVHEPKVKCPICHKPVTNLIRHKLFVHPAKNKLYFCDACEFKSARKSRLEDHKKTHGPKVKCLICNKLVTDIQSHKYRAHLETNKLYGCDVCELSYASKSALNDHKKIHEPKVKCPICHKLVTNVKKHKRNEHPRKDKLCDAYEFKSARKSRLEDLKKIHEPKVKCPICHKLVTDVKKHKRNEHPHIYVCNVCSFKSTKKSCLEQHKLIHEPKVKCLICYKLVRDIKSHILKVHPVKFSVR